MPSLPSLAACVLILDWSIRLLALLTIPARHPPAAARTWLLLVGFLPLFGLPIYLLLSRPWLAPARIARQAEVSAAIRAAHPAEPVAFEDGCARLAQLAQRLGDLPACAGNRIDLLGDYAAAIDDLAAGIDAAGREVHLLYYIVADDAVGGRVLAALRRAAARGVRCLLLVDALASKAFLHSDAAALREAGVEVRAMLLDRLWAAAGRLDLRNHRKLAIIDGHTGWLGSQNLVDPNFIVGAPNVELVARVRGPIVAQLQAVFAGDVYIETGERIANDTSTPAAAGAATAQMLPGGPAYPFENARDIIVALVQHARSEVVLCTPYFVPDEAVLRALCIAALSGVQVHLIVSARSNQALVDWAQRAYYIELLRSGVRIHRFQAGFLHAKHISVDARIGMLGSINLDVRSFALNAETGLLIYTSEVAGRLREVQRGYIDASIELTQEAWQRRPLWQRSVEGLARLANGFL
ncbi:MAG TPA: cardiolipin synthase [Dokdonella sp.]